eukprot:s678_g11.t3
MWRFRAVGICANLHFKNIRIRDERARGSCVPTVSKGGCQRSWGFNGKSALQEKPPQWPGALRRRWAVQMMMSRATIGGVGPLGDLQSSIWHRPAGSSGSLQATCCERSAWCAIFMPSSLGLLITRVISDRRRASTPVDWAQWVLGLNREIEVWVDDGEEGGRWTAAKVKAATDGWLTVVFDGWQQDCAADADMALKEPSSPSVYGYRCAFFGNLDLHTPEHRCLQATSTMARSSSSSLLFPAVLLGSFLYALCPREAFFLPSAWRPEPEAQEASPSRPLQELRAANLFLTASPSVLSVSEGKKNAPGPTGTGFVWDASHVVTNFHVVKELKSPHVTFLRKDESGNEDHITVGASWRQLRAKAFAVRRPTSPAAEHYLGLVDAFLERQPRQTFLKNGAGLLQTFGPSLGGGDCGDLCALPAPCPEFGVSQRCRYDVYDNAVAALYLTKRGKLVAARRILDAFLHLLYPPKQIPHLSFGARDGLPSGRWLTLIGSSYTEQEVTAGSYYGKHVVDGGVAAHDILHALKRTAVCNDKLLGFMAKLRPYPANYRSTEHNIDMYALAKVLGDEDAANRARVFVQEMFGFNTRYPQSFAMGTDGEVPCDVTFMKTAVPADGVFWNLLAGAEPAKERKTAAVAAALQSIEDEGLLTWDEDVIGNATGGRPENLRGMRFSNWGNGVQWENTAAAVMALLQSHEEFEDGFSQVELTEEIDHMRSSILKLLDTYGAVPASVLGGNYQAWQKNEHRRTFPGGSDTGIGWTYYRYPHVAATAWAGLLLLFQFDNATQVNEAANPYFPPEPPLPRRARGGFIGLCAYVVGADPLSDIAILQVNAEENAHVASLMQPLSRGASEFLKPGQEVFALGNPFGLEHSMSKGVISGVSRSMEGTAGWPMSGIIQTDASINPGNSGGPLLNSEGSVVGVNTAILSTSGTFSGVGFALPIDTVQKNVESMIEEGYVTRPSIGVELAPDEVSESLGVPGAMVMKVVPGGPAQRAGMRALRSGQLGDVIVKMGSRPIASSSDVFRYLDQRQPGELVVMSVQRASSDLTSDDPDIVDITMIRSASQRPHSKTANFQLVHLPRSCSDSILRHWRLGLCVVGRLAKGAANLPF